ncbi:MAG: XRE family transcriptional regulator [Candidatus Cloacimonadaceae bacterium]|nr:XRE family transcriptional regulator [Candidatus Cloacimonadaceae bacterium]
MRRSEIGERLAKVMKMMRLKHSNFAEKFNISSASLSRYKSGDRLPDPAFLIALSKSRINTNWLLTGEGTMNIQQEFDGWIKDQVASKIGVVNSNTGLYDSPTVDYTRTVTLQILGEIAAGRPDPILDLRHLGDQIEIPRRILTGNPDKYLAFRVNGHSMEPNIMHEDLVVIKQETNWTEAHNRVCAVRTDEGATLKKVILDEQTRRIILQPFNIDFQVQIIDEDQGLDIFLIGLLSLQLRFF